MINLMTKEGFDNLVARLAYLKKKKRVEVSDQIKAAISIGGDADENPELELARQEQAMVETEISALESKLENTKIVTNKGRANKIVRIGSKVQVRAKKTKLDLFIVGAMEANPREGKISHASPIGKALLDKKVGEKVEVELPDGNMEYKICQVA